MNDKFDIVSGNFRGYFYTNQKTALASGEKIPVGKMHEIHLYQGELNDVVKESEYKPETLRNRESLVLHNVTNVQFHLNSATESKKQIYNFEQLLLNNPVVENSWELNGKTYGIVSGNLLGKVKELSSIVGPINPPPNPNPPINPNPLINPNPKPNPINNGGNGGGNNNGGNGENKKGCLAAPLALLSGCLANIWRILLFLFLLGLLFWLFKNCMGGKEINKDCCGALDTLKTENNRLKIRFDSLRRVIIDNEKQRQKDSVQTQISSLAGKIFFKKKKTEIRGYSNDEIEKIVSILNKYPTAKIEVQGYYDVKASVLNLIMTDELDRKRAERVREFLIEKGINSNRITAIGKGRSNLDESESVTGYDDEGNPYNRNMRVDIIVTNF